MAYLGWQADGIERARAASGIELELYRRPGFTGGKAVRRSLDGGPGGGFEVSETDGYADADPEPEDFRR